jgi:hypothetical protein
VVTALGFATGTATLDSSVQRGGPFLRLYAWPLVGCTVSVATIFWRGPMLIVFGMIAGGAVAVVLREILRRYRSSDSGV